MPRPEQTDPHASPGIVDLSFWRERPVLVTGYTGFKGSWLCLWLQLLGANVSGFADGVPTEPSLFELADIGSGMTEIRGDIRDATAVRDAVAASRPEIVIHMAAQPMVRDSFDDPRGTYETNVMGTVNVLEAVRTAGAETVRAAVNVTSDKCYDNREQGRPFVESDPMGGHDPYSNSKGCAELVTDAYRRSFFTASSAARIASARAGNVIGGGDWGKGRLVPDIVRAAEAGTPIAIRNPDAVRPWQHVLNPLSGYLLIAQALCGSERDAAAVGWNLGPDERDVQPVHAITTTLTDLWPRALQWEIDPGPHPHEAHFLSLDSTQAREQLGWRPRWNLAAALAAIVDWHLALRDGDDMRAVSTSQIDRFLAS